MRRGLSLFLLSALTACGGAEHEDLKKWMLDQEGSMTKGIKDPPELKPYEPVTYEAFEMLDPFNSARIQVSTAERGPPDDEDRVKEPLEAFPLESLRMVGTFEQAKKVYGIVRAENGLHRVQLGNRIGQNRGKITQISDSELTVRELVPDDYDGWKERDSTLLLQEQEASK